MTITVVFDPPLPSDPPATFNTKAFSTLGHLNTWSAEANAMAAQVNADKASASTSAAAAEAASGTATTKATEASTSASNAASSATTAASAASNAQAAYDAFDDRFLGPKASDPTVDNDGNALLVGALYFNTTSNAMKVYSGTAWGNVAPVATSVSSSEISDATTVGRSVLTAADAAAARTAIGAGTGSGDVTLSGTQTLSNKTLTGLRETRVALAANNIDLATGNVFTKTISGATTLTVSNVPASGTTATFILDLTNGGSATVTWWSGMKWAGGTAPTLTAAGRDVLGFFTHDGGATWIGLLLGKDVK